jgi:hypothetical protein
MGFTDDFNDSFGNVDGSLKAFSSRHPHERIVYSSNGVLFRRIGDQPLRRWTRFLNRRGNLIVSERRCFFHNPVLSIENVLILMMSIVLFIMVFLEVFLLAFGYMISGSIFQSCICGLVPLPFFSLFAILAGMAMAQRIPTVIDLEFERMRSITLDQYQFLTRRSPMFSCFDGTNTYHIIGYKILSDEQSNRIHGIIRSKK